MKRRSLSVAMAVVMSVVCLTGCSGKLSKDSFISAAKKNGMKDAAETTELTHILADPGEIRSFFYDVEDFRIIEYSGGPLADCVSPTDVEEFVIAIDSIGKTDDHGSTLTQVFFLTVKDSKTAKEIYKTVSKPLVKPEKGEKNGVTYTISYQGSKNEGSSVELAYGVYLKDNQIVLIRSDYYSSLDNKCVEGFCRSLGLVSPYTLR